MIKRFAPGRRIILLHAESKEEAITVCKLMLEHLENNCHDNGRTIQSAYTDESGVLWFG